MAKIQLVIEIDELIYKFIKAHKKEEPFGWLSTKTLLTNAIINGKPLPKGHGDLVDFDRLCKEYWDGNYMEIHKDDLSNIKPIIEADKEVI